MASATMEQGDIENPPPPAVELEPPTLPVGDLNSPCPPDRGEDYTIDMITLFVASTCGIGGALAAIYNLGHIGRALGYSASTATTFISLVSIWSYLGQVAFETFLSRYRFARPVMLSLVLFLSCFGHFLIAFGVLNSLFVASVITGFSFGVQWRLHFAITSEIFGLKYYFTLYNFGALASPVGMYILNMNVGRWLYNREALKQMEAKGLKMLAGEDLSCTGLECYKKAFFVITAAMLFGCTVSLVLVFRMRKVYRGDMDRNFIEQAEAQAEEGANAVVELISKGASGNAVGTGGAVEQTCTGVDG